MVKFSDLEKNNLNPEKSRDKVRGERSRPSGLSFRDLEKEAHRMTSPEDVLPEEDSEEERTAIYDTATVYLTGVLAAVRKRQQFALEPGEEIVRRFIESRSTADPLLIRAIYQDNPHGYLINHCVNVAVFAVKMAAELGLGKFEQEQIGLAALLHEVGMGVIPEKLIYKEQKLDEQEYAIFKKRPEFAYKILNGFGDDYAFLAETALQVHECMDGSGYPMGLRGDGIHLYAQIIGLVDMYEALIHSRPQRNKFSHFSAVKQIIKIGKRRYVKNHLKTLLNIFSIFPLHSIVKLNSNAFGRVIQTYPDQPMRPKIEVVFDSQGRRVLAKHAIDLSENSILYIVDSVSEEDIQSMTAKSFVKPYLQTQAPAPYGHESAIIQDIDEIDGEAFPFPETDIIELTEVDREQSPAAIGKDASEPERSAFSMQSKEAEEKEDEFVDETLVSRPATEKGGWIRRHKGVLVGIVILSGVLLWLLGQTYFSSNNAADEPGGMVTPSEKKVSAGPQNKAMSESAVSSAEIPPAPAAIPPADETKTSAPEVQPLADKNKIEVAAALIPAGDAAAALEAYGGSYPFSIKLDSFRTLKETQAALPAYRAKGLHPYWVKVNLGSHGAWYRIFEGTYQSGEQAAAVISRLELKNAVVKETKYAALIGMFSSQSAIHQKIQLLSDMGYSPYVIQGRDQIFFLFVGTFYSRKGSEEQVADLLSKGIQGEIVER